MGIDFLVVFSKCVSFCSLSFHAHLCCSIYWPHMLTFLNILTLYILSSSSWYHCGDSNNNKDYPYPRPLTLTTSHPQNSPSHLITSFYSFNLLLTNNTTTSETLIFKHLTSLSLSPPSVFCNWMLKISLQWNINSFSCCSLTLPSVH